MDRFLTKDELREALDRIAPTVEFFAPAAEGGRVLFRRIKSFREIASGYVNSTLSPKEIFFPPSEPILRFERVAQTVQIHPVKLPTEEKIIWGIHPCDARGFLFLDKVFGGEFKDEFYLARRRSTLLVAELCNQPDRACFCISMGGSPALVEGVDAFFFSEGDSLWLRLLTARGEALLGGLGKETTDFEGKLSEFRKTAESRLEKRCRTTHYLASGFGDDYWQVVSLSCIGCGVCAAVCPTCHCFDICEEKDRRLRVWDTCCSKHFTRMASGENPRFLQTERFRQRVFHKFDYFRRLHGVDLCVGCGRCIRMCPVKLDIAEVVSKAPIKEEKPETCKISTSQVCGR